jgi:CSLREA domain-containing protein
MKLKHLASFILLFLLIGGIASCTPTPTLVCSDVFNVTTNIDSNDGACTAGLCSLRDAVIAANACPGLQTINVPAGNYQLTVLGAEEDAAATGDLDITDDLILRGEGVPSLDGVNQDRLLEVFSPAVVQIDLFIIINGRAQIGAGIYTRGEVTISNSSIHDNIAVVPPGGAGAAAGGGIFIESGHTTLTNTDVFSNSADAGGGVHVFATSSYTMTGGHIMGNSATMYGGGLWNNMAAISTLNNVEISQNTAVERGAGIYNDGSLKATLVTLNENSDVQSGGGAYNDVDAEMFLYLDWFTNNSAQLGGAIYNAGLLHLYQGSLTNNSALGGRGGGVYNTGAGAALLVQNTTISGNMIVPFSSPGGSGIYNEAGDLRLEFATLAYNNADGIDNVGGHFTLRSSILAYHSLGNCAGSPADSQGFNLEDGNTCHLIEPSDLTDTDPLLVWLDMNGGSNLSHALGAGSPAIDSGDPDLCIEIDQRGMSRPQLLACDRGAIEVDFAMPTPVSTVSSAPVALALDNANCRKGPGVGYESMAMLTQGQAYDLTGRSPLGDWWRVALPNGLACWVSDILVDVSGDTGQVLVVEPPPLPTDTPTPLPGCWVSRNSALVCVSPCPPKAVPGGACTP